MFYKILKKSSFLGDLQLTNYFLNMYYYIAPVMYGLAKGGHLTSIQYLYNVKKYRRFIPNIVALFRRWAKAHQGVPY